MGLADVGTTITFQGYDVGQFARTAKATAPADCLPPVFTTGMGGSNCQAGDSGTKVQNFDVQLFQNDGSDLTISKTTPMTSCHYRLLDDLPEL